MKKEAKGFDRPEFKSAHKIPDPSGIRAYSLAGLNSEVRKYLISDSARKVWKWVFDVRKATASEVSGEFDISIQHASGILNKLYKLQYLRRDENPQASGGYEWVYYP